MLMANFSVILSADSADVLRAKFGDGIIAIVAPISNHFADVP